MAETDPHRVNYLAFAHGQLVAPQGAAFEDGRALASQCLTQLDQHDDLNNSPRAC